MDVRSFDPPRRILMGPGPSDVPARVLQAMARPTIGHLDPEFVRMMDELKELLRYAFQTENELTMPLSAPGSAGMETCFVNLVGEGDEVVICRNGVFGGRMASIVERSGAKPILVEQEWGRAVDPQALDDALGANPNVRCAAFVHAETSTGALSDAKALAQVARRHECLTIVDAVTSLGGSRLEVDEWGLDAVYSGSQKCLSCTPGLSPLTLSARAVEQVRGREQQVQSWFLDLNLVMGYWGGGQRRSYHHTAPVNALYGLHEALVILKEEGLTHAWDRHQRNHRALRAGLEAMGLSLVVPEAERIPQLNAVSIPDGVDDGAVRTRLLGEYGLEIGGGLGGLAGKVWRIGLMGASSQPGNVLTCLSALEACLAGKVNAGVAVDAAREHL